MSLLNIQKKIDILEKLASELRSATERSDHALSNLNIEHAEQILIEALQSADKAQTIADVEFDQFRAFVWRAHTSIHVKYDKLVEITKEIHTLVNSIKTVLTYLHAAKMPHVAADSKRVVNEEMIADSVPPRVRRQCIEIDYSATSQRLFVSEQKTPPALDAMTCTPSLLGAGCATS